VKKGGSERASRHFDNKGDAVKWGREVSKNQGSEFYVHRRDGTIEQKASHGSGPHALDVPKRPIWELVVELGAQIPEKEWTNVPDDASINFKHYLYGAPKQNA
jgi:hypothetical protein